MRYVIVVQDELGAVLGVYGVWPDEEGANRGKDWLRELPGMAPDLNVTAHTLYEIEDGAR